MVSGPSVVLLSLFTGDTGTIVAGFKMMHYVTDLPGGVSSIIVPSFPTE